MNATLTLALVVMSSIGLLGPEAAALPDDKTDAQLLGAELHAVADARVHIPRGWKIKFASKGDPKPGEAYLHLSHVDEDGEVSQIALMQARGTRSQLKKMALNLMSPQEFGFDATEKDVTLTESRQGYPVAYVRDWARSEELGRGVEARAFAMKPRSAVELVFYLSTADGVEEYAREDELEAFIRDLRFASAREPRFDPMTPRISTQRIEALAYTTRLTNTINVFGGMDLDMDVDYALFTPDGRYSSEVPSDGQVERIDWETLARDKPRSTGVYEMRRRRGSLEAELTIRTLDQYGFLDEVEGRVVFQPATEVAPEKIETLEVEGRNLALIPPLASRRLRGRYTYIYGSSGSGASSSGSVSGSKTIVFTRAGKFEASSFFSASFSHEFGDSTTSGVTSSKKPATSGRYRLNGYTLELTFDERTVVRRFCHPCGDEDDAMLMIDESPYLFKGRR